MARGLALAALVAALDQATKWVIVALVFAPTEPIRMIGVTGFFNIVLVHNRGVSFGMLGGLGALAPWVLIGATAAIAAALVVWLRRAASPMMAIGVGLVLGGAVGNLIDRVRIGVVVDFLDFHAMGYHWPSFNLADSAIVVGVALLLLDGLKSKTEVP